MMVRNRKTALVGLVAVMSMLGLLAPASADHVAIDIIPDSPHNAIKTLQAIVPVAVLGSATLDVADVDADSLCFGSAERPRARNCSREDGLRVRDTNGDGFADLEVRFSIAGSGIRQDDTTACMDGALAGGASFEACDMIRAGRG